MWIHVQQLLQKYLPPETLLGSKSIVRNYPADLRMRRQTQVDCGGQQISSKGKQTHIYYSVPFPLYHFWSDIIDQVEYESTTGYSLTTSVGHFTRPSIDTR